MMLARWAPASTAMTEPFLHSDCGARTSRPVIVSSRGPPQHPYIRQSALFVRASELRHENNGDLQIAEEVVVASG